MAGANLDSQQLERYGRNIFLDRVGAKGQARLLDSNVLVVGAGGLGSPIIAYLAAAGVGHLDIVDPDIVERSNLQRQIIHGESDLDRSKVASAADFVADVNPDVAVETHDIELGRENIRTFLEDADFVVDSTDNFPTRFLINDACTLAEIPFSHGAVLAFSGQVTTFGVDGEPCYRCVFPEAPPPGTVPDCATAGVLGVVPGTIGCIQATETLKSILGIGQSLSGRIVHYDALDLSFETVSISQASDCPVCGEHGIASIDEVTYTEQCSIETEQ